MKYDDKKQIRRHKKNVGNQKARAKVKQLLQHDPTNEDLLKEPQHGKLTSQGYNGLDKDKTRKTEYHQEGNAPLLLESAEVSLDLFDTILDLFDTILELASAIGDA